MREGQRNVAPIGLAVMMATAVALPADQAPAPEARTPERGGSAAQADAAPLELRRDPIPERRPVRVILPSPYASQR